MFCQRLADAARGDENHTYTHIAALALFLLLDRCTLVSDFASR
jgi:hypothetical protein